MRRISLTLIIFLVFVVSTVADGKDQDWFISERSGGINFFRNMRETFLAAESPAPPPIAVKIPDRNLEAVLREALNKPTGAITDFDLEVLMELEAQGRKIADLTGLEYATYLRKLDLRKNQIRDLQPLQNLTRLTLLILVDNQISDIHPLGHLTQLTRLDLGGNQISDIRPLANLIWLKYLYLSSKLIRDIRPLENLTQLKEIELQSNPIRDIQSLKHLNQLEKLYLGGTQIKHLQPLLDNPGLGPGDFVDVVYSPLSQTAIDQHIPALRARGVTVNFPIPFEGDRWVEKWLGLDLVTNTGSPLVDWVNLDWISQGTGGKLTQAQLATAEGLDQLWEIDAVVLPRHGGQLKWSEITIEPKDYHNMSSSHDSPPQHNIDWYGLIVIHSPNRRQTTIYPSHGNYGQIWLNGKKVYDNPRWTNSPDYVHPTVITLRSEQNVLLFRCSGIDRDGFVNLGLHAADAELSIEVPKLPTHPISELTIDKPPIALSQSVKTDENTSKAITLTGRDPGGNTLTFTVVERPSHGSLIGEAPYLTYTPHKDFKGTDNFTFKVNNGRAESEPATVDITVTTINDTPYFAPIEDQIIAAGAEKQTITITGVSPGNGRDEAVQKMTLKATSSDPSIVPHPTIESSGRTHTLTYQPVEGATGTVTITVTANDDGPSKPPRQNAFSRTFTITIRQQEPKYRIYIFPFQAEENVADKVKGYITREFMHQLINSHRFDINPTLSDMPPLTEADVLDARKIVQKLKPRWRENRITPAQYIIVGTVTQISQDGDSRKLDLDARLIDVYQQKYIETKQVDAIMKGLNDLETIGQSARILAEKMSQAIPLYGMVTSTEETLYDDGPVTGRVTKVGINLGRKLGVRKGMIFSVITEQPVPHLPINRCNIHIVRVYDETAIGIASGWDLRIEIDQDRVKEVLTKEP